MPSARPDDALLQRNLEALASTQPVLAQRLLRVEPAALIPAKNGEPTCQFTVGAATRWLHSAYDPSAESRRLAQLVPGDAPAVMLVGAGLGYLPALLLATRPELTMVIVEPELRFLRAMLGLFDLSEALAGKRLIVLLADDGDIAVQSILPADPFVVTLPALRDAYSDRRRQLRFLSRRGGERGRVIAVNYKLYLADLADLLEDEGFAVRVVEPKEITIESFHSLCAAIQPSFLFSINFSPELALLSTRERVPYASWTIDPLPPSRLRLHPGTDPRSCLAYAHRRDLVDELRRCGLTDAEYLPLAAGRHRVPITDDARLVPYRCPISFAGVSLAVERDGLTRRLRQLGGDDALAARLGAWARELFDARGDAYDYFGLPADGSALPPWLLQGLSPVASPVELADRINGLLSHLLRLRRVELLVPHGMRVWGDEGWGDFGDAYRGRADHTEQLTLVYNASAINLDIPRIYQRDVATMRVFDVLACGGVLLTEPSRQVLEMFGEGEHLVTYRNDRELIERAREIAADPEGARAIARRGRELVEREHLLSHRLKAILAAAETRGWLER
jgi:hypothetical protein